jgi:hypothetical protein
MNHKAHKEHEADGMRVPFFVSFMTFVVQFLTRT